MNNETLKQKVNYYQTLMKHYVNNKEPREDFCNIQHVVNNHLTTLQGTLELMIFDEPNEFLNDLLEDIPTITQNLDDYFQLIETNPKLLTEELNEGYYPDKRKQLTDQEYIQYLINNYPK